MSVKVHFSSIVQDKIPTIGYIVTYRIKGSTGDYTTVNLPIGQTPEFTTTDPIGTIYEGFIKPDCGEGFVTSQYPWVSTCNCPEGYSLYPDSSGCYSYETQAATIVHSDYCLAISTHSNYGIYGTRIYDGDQTASFTYITTPYWRNGTDGVTGDSSHGQLNLSGVWIDSNCDGTKDPLTSGQKTTIAFNYYNPGTDKVVYIGVAGDNSFVLSNNNVIIADSDVMYGTGSAYIFKMWNIFKVTLRSGNNLINVIGRGDGGTNDALGMIIYDNTSTQLQAATQDSDLNILFNTKNLRGTSYSVATCPDGYSMDTSYNCTKITNAICNS